MFERSRFILLLCVTASAVSMFAQEGVNVGGKWMKSDGQDPSNSAKVVFFTLLAEDAELGRSPAIQLECTGDGKLVHARYFADTELEAKDGDYANYDAPAIIPRVRVDKKSFKGLWDLLPGHMSAELDKKTLRAIFKGTEMQVRYTDKAYNNFVDVFPTLTGLNRREVVKACGEHDWVSAGGR